MDTKTIVKYASYVAGAIALISLIGSAPLQVFVIVAVVAVNKLYVGR